MVITFTVSSAYTNAFYIPSVIIETPGNYIFHSKFKLQTTFLNIGTKEVQTSQRNILSIIVDAMLITNVFIFCAKNVVELSIGVNKVTNIIEAVNLTFLLFAFFVGFTLKGLTVISNYQSFDEEHQSRFYSF